jgi:site-specific DNA-adenine methylase
VKTKSALSFFGSDSEVAGRLASYLDHCRHVSIPFVGGASILPHLRAKSIVANDMNCEAINFYRVAAGVYGQHAQAKLIELCQATLSHPDEMERAARYLGDDSRGVSFERAWAYWAMCWIGRKGKGGTRHLGGQPSVRRTAMGGNNATRLAAAAGDLMEWANHFQRCEWEQSDFRVMLPKVADIESCGVYCDPPWPGAGRDYLHTFTEPDHMVLRDYLNRFKQSTVVVRYGESDFIRKLYADWTVIDSASRTQTNVVKGEIWLIKNYRENGGTQEV